MAAAISSQQKGALNEQQIINPPSQLGAGEAFLTNMIVDPSVESATYHVDALNNPTIRASKIPIQHHYKLAEHDWSIISRVNMGYMTVHQSAIVTPWGGSFKPSWEGASVTFGGGVEVPLNKHWTLVPTLDLGVARFHNNTKFYGELNNETLKPAFDNNAITNWKSQAGTLSGALMLDHKHKFGDYNVDSRLIYALSTVKTFRESSQLRSFDEQIDSAAVRINIKKALGISLFSYPLSGIVHISGNSFVGGDRHALGFNEYGELGASMVFDISQHQWAMDSFSLGVKGLYGQNVRGWSILMDYNI
tara:strand:+ start:886 stop:1800 length:915 start_codon:yes stop_codon:yes gene_type:complete